jgi:hypothetical protein
VSSQEPEPGELQRNEVSPPEQPPGEFQRSEVSPAGQPILYVIAAVGAAASIFFLRSGFLGLLFLFPLGLIAFLGNEKTAWFATLLAILGNVAVSVSYFLRQGVAPIFLQWNALYFGVMAIIFTWINAPPGWIQRLFPLRSVYRLALGSILGTLVMVPYFLLILEMGGLESYFADQVATINSLSGRLLSAHEILDYLSYIGLRGGILISCLVFLGISRQLAVTLSWLFRHVRPSGGLISFHVDSFLIWILSAALGLVLAGRAGGIEAAEIAGWNLLALCGILYLAQGGGIALYFLIKLPPVLRIAANVGLVLMLFSPGINALLLGSLTLVGIVENWFPLRVPKKEE